MKAIEHINGDPLDNNLRNLRLVEMPAPAPSPARLAADKISEARAESARAVEDALACLQEASRRAFEVVGACGPSLIGYGRHARLTRLAATIALELMQIESLP